MVITQPQDALSLSSKLDGITDDGTHFLLRMKRDASKFFFDNRHAYPTPENYAAVAQHWLETTDIQFSPEQAEAILALYPQARIKVAVYGGIADTDVRDELGFAISHFFLGCTWPTFGDKIDIDEFVSLLKKQASLMGFSPAVESA